MRRVVSTLTGICLIGTLSAAEATPLHDVQQETQAVLSRAGDGTELCFPPIVGPASAHVVDAHSGRELLDANGSKDGPTLVDVVVERTKEPALIVLSGDRPIVWQILAEPDADIAGIHLTGRNEQFITGLTEEIPVGRSFKEQKFGAIKLRCRDRAKAAIPNPDRDRLAALRKEMNGPWESRIVLKKRLQLAEAQVRELEKVDADLLRGGASDSVRSVFSNMLKNERRMATQLKARLEEISRQLTTIVEEIKVLNKGITKTDKPSGRIHRPYDLRGYAKRLRERGKFELASFERLGADGEARFVISNDAATAFQKRKQEGERILTKVTIPSFPLLPKNAPRLRAPENLSGNAGLAYLVEKGYLRPSTDAARYVCDKDSARALVLGMEPQESCAVQMRKVRDTYTVFGPIVVPEDVCFTQFYLPPEIAIPEGLECHSHARHLECVGILDRREQVDCSSRLRD